MKVARIAVLAVAAAAGLGAAYIVSNQKPETTQVVAAAPAPVVPADEVLTVTHDISIGNLVTTADLAWTSWPKASMSDGMIKESDAPTALVDLSGSVARGDFFRGEPVRREKLVKGASSGFMSAILPSGERAVAINTDGNGATSAGGFILPNDRVDVIRTYRDDEASRAASSDIWKTETVLRNVRVLAIGQNIQDKDGTRVVTGTNATLEVSPRQAEQLVLAQRGVPLSLVLRSMMDAAKVESPDAPEAEAAKALTVVRYGVAAQISK